MSGANVIGGVPPFGHATHLSVFIDPDLLQYDEVWAAAGTCRDVFGIEPHELVEAREGLSRRPEVQLTIGPRTLKRPGIRGGSRVPFGRELMPSGPGTITPYAPLDDVLLDHAASMREVLADCFVGIYPVGSLAIGDFDLTSDIDFVVVPTHSGRRAEPYPGRRHRRGVHRRRGRSPRHPIRRACYLPPGWHQHRSLPRRPHASKAAAPPW